jgi:hypothetical protein
LVMPRTARDAKSGRGGGSAPLLEAIATVDGPTLGGLEGNRGFLAALGAFGGGLGALAAWATHDLAPLRFTGFTPLGLVLKAFVGVKNLLACGEGKISPAIDAFEGLIPVFHAWLPGPTWAHLRHGGVG